jgi:hypothetical protein
MSLFSPGKSTALISSPSTLLASGKGKIVLTIRRELSISVSIPGPDVQIQMYSSLLEKGVMYMTHPPYQDINPPF